MFYLVIKMTKLRQKAGSQDTRRAVMPIANCFALQVSVILSSPFCKRNCFNNSPIWRAIKKKTVTHCLGLIRLPEPYPTEPITSLSDLSLCNKELDTASLNTLASPPPWLHRLCNIQYIAARGGWNIASKQCVMHTKTQPKRDGCSYFSRKIAETVLI